jgi:hypothetical protein
MRITPGTRQKRSRDLFRMWNRSTSNARGGERRGRWPPSANAPRPFLSERASYPALHREVALEPFASAPRARASTFPSCRAATLLRNSSRAACVAPFVPVATPPLNSRRNLPGSRSRARRSGAPAVEARHRLPAGCRHPAPGPRTRPRWRKAARRNIAVGPRQVNLAPEGRSAQRPPAMSPAATRRRLPEAENLCGRLRCRESCTATSSVSRKGTTALKDSRLPRGRSLR